MADDDDDLKKEQKRSVICSCCNPVKTPTNHSLAVCLERTNEMPPCPAARTLPELNVHRRQRSYCKSTGERRTKLT